MTRFRLARLKEAFTSHRLPAIEAERWRNFRRVGETREKEDTRRNIGGGGGNGRRRTFSARLGPEVLSKYFIWEDGTGMAQWTGQWPRSKKILSDLSTKEGEPSSPFVNRERFTVNFLPRIAPSCFYAGHSIRANPRVTLDNGCIDA